MFLSYDKGSTDGRLMESTIGEALELTAALYPETEALVSVHEGRRLTYRAFAEEVNQCARALIALGVEKGDRVGIWSTNCVAWVLVQFASAKVGAILVNINPAYRLHELEFALKQSECNYLIAGTGFKDCDYGQMLCELMPELGEGRPIASLPHMRKVIYLGSRDIKGMLGWDELLAGHIQLSDSDLRRRMGQLDCRDVINIQYTSGTTGFPKGAMLTHRGIVNNGFWVGERMRLTQRDRLCIPVPFYHCFGMVLGNMACVTHGSTMVLPAPHFSPLHTLQAVAAEHCTGLHGVPTMFLAELEHPQFTQFDLSTLRTGIMAGAPCPTELMKRVIGQMHCSQITIACGMTETSPVCNMTEIDDPIELRVSTVGRVMPHQEQKIIDPASKQTLPRGEVGELCYRGYQVMRGYYNNPQATAETIDPEGWLHGGDLAVMDDRGYVRIMGRLKDMIIRGGEKIYAREVEEFLYTHPKIAEAYVVGVPDPYYGEQVVAWVKLKEGCLLSQEQVREFCKGKIMDQKIPAHVKFVTEFPATITGKIQKYRMREISKSEIKN